MAFRLSAGQRHEMTVFEELLDAGKVKRAGRGRPKVRAWFVLADRAYSGVKAHRCCQRRGMRLVVPPKRNHKRPRSHARDRYRQRNVIERLMHRLKRSRRIATRFDSGFDVHPVIGPA